VKTQRIIWLIALMCAAVAGAVLIGRGTVHAPGAGDLAALSSRTLRALEADPLVRSEQTRRLVTALADYAGSTPEPSAEAWYAKGLRLRNSREMTAAAEALERAAELRPAWSWPWNMLGIVRYDLDDAAGSEAAFRKAIALDPEWSRAYSDFGVMLRKEGRLDDAEDMARAALELDPDGLAPLNNYGNLLFVRGKYAEAREAYLKALQVDPDHPSPYYNLACVASLLGDAEAAADALAAAIARNEAFRTAARTDPDLAPVRNAPAIQALLSGEHSPEPAATEETDSPATQ
jgi:tetratricopeptide (TPR) repeat protein